MNRIQTYLLFLSVIWSPSISSKLNSFLKLIFAVLHQEYFLHAKVWSDLYYFKVIRRFVIEKIMIDRPSVCHVTSGNLDCFTYRFVYFITRF